MQYQEEVHNKLIDFTKKTYQDEQSLVEMTNYIGRNIKYLDESDCELLNKIKNIFMKNESVNLLNLEAIDSYIVYIDFIKYQSLSSHLDKNLNEPFWMYYLTKHNDQKNLEKLVEMIGNAKDLQKELSSMYKNNKSYLNEKSSNLIKLACFLPDDKKDVIVNILKLYKDYGLKTDTIDFRQIKDPNKLFEIAVLCIQNKWIFTQQINHDLEIMDQKQWFEIAKLLAQQNGAGMAYHIKNFKTLDQNQRFEIAMLCAHQSGLSTALYIKNFGAMDKDQLFKVAIICSREVSIAESIKNFGTFTQEQLFEIAKLCAQQNGEDTAKYINNFFGTSVSDYLKDDSKDYLKDQLFEIAKLCAQQNPITAFYIKNFGTFEQGPLFEIAKLCSCQAKIAMYMTNFEILNQDQIFEIAKLCAQQDGVMTAKNIHNFETMDQNQLFEIAKLCAQNKSIAMDIKNFGILNQDQLFEIAKLCANQDGYETAMHIKNFQIKEPEKLFGIAILCAQQACNSSRSIAIHIENFGIMDQEQLFEIAQLCAIGSGYQTAMHIKNFQIKERGKLFEIAKLCCKSSGIAEYIPDFGIFDQIQLFEIAMLCAKQGRTAPYFKVFKTLDKNKLFEIAMLCAHEDMSTAQYIKTLTTLDQDQLFEIAKICAQNTPVYNMANHIINQDFGILDQNQLFEIIKLWAKQDGAQTATLIEHFGTFDTGQLFEIAMLCIQQAEWKKVLCSIKLDKDTLFKIIKFCAQQNIAETKRFKLFSKTIKEEKIWEDLEELFLQEAEEEFAEPFNFNNAKKILVEYQSHNFVGNPFNKVLENIMQISEPHSKQQNIMWLANTMIIFNLLKSFNQLTDEQILWLNERDIIVSIADFGKPILRFQLSLCAAFLTSDKIGKEQASALLHYNQSNKDKSFWKKLTCLLSAMLISQGVDRDIFIEENFFRSETEKSLGIFEKKENYQALIEMLLRLVQDTQLTGNEKGQVLNRIINERKDKKKLFQSLSNKELQTEYLNNIRFVIAIVDFGEINLLKNSSKSLTEITENIFKEKFHLGTIQDYLSKYIDIFGDCRNPSAITTYAAKINSLKDKKAAACLGNYFTSVLNGTFKEERYKIDNNPHLKQLNEFNPTLLENWKKYECLKLSELILVNTSIYKKTPKEWMHMKLITDKHLNLEKEELNYLKNFLISTDLEESNQVKENLKNACNEQLKISKINKIEGVLLTLASDINADYKNLEKLDLKDITEAEIQLKTKWKNFNSQIKKLKDKEMSKNLFEIKNNLNDLNNLYEKTEKEKKGEIYKKENKKIISIENNLMDLEKSLECDTEKLCKLRLQQICIQWIYESEKDGVSRIKNGIAIIDKPDFGKLKSILQEIQKILETAPFNRPEFINDIQGKFKEMESKKLEEENVVVIDIDDPIDLLLCGTDVSGSCQRVEGDASLNKGLLGYLMDGKNRLLIIKSSEEPSSKILARSILRLLWDGEKPVLFLENFYPEGINTKYAQALIAMAQKKADSIGVPLLSKNGQGQIYDKTLMALGGPAPWEYSDGVGGNQANGIYEIQHTKYMK